MGPIGEYPEDRKEVWAPLDLIEDDHTPQILEGQHRVREPGQVDGVLQVKQDTGMADMGDELPSEGGLPHLAGAHEGDDGIPGEQVSKLLEMPGTRQNHTINRVCRGMGAELKA